MICDIPNVRFTYKWGHETQRAEESKIDDENSQNFFASKCLHIFCTQLTFHFNCVLTAFVQDIIYHGKYWTERGIKKNTSKTSKEISFVWLQVKNKAKYATLKGRSYCMTQTLWSFRSSNIPMIIHEVANVVNKCSWI